MPEAETTRASPRAEVLWRLGGSMARGQEGQGNSIGKATGPRVLAGPIDKSGWRVAILTQICGGFGGEGIGSTPLFVMQRRSISRPSQW